MKSYMDGMLECNKSSKTDNTNPGGQTALCHHWKLAGYIANLPPNRWAKRALEWQPRAKRVGRRQNTWVTKIEEFTRWKRWDNWQSVAVRNPALWEQSMLEVVQFALGR